MDFGKLSDEQKEVAQYIADHARQKGIDPELALAIGWRESYFNRRAIGPLTKSGHAIGPMQVMESNAEGLKLKKSDLYDYKKNVEAGMQILGDNLKTHSGNERAALVAYNARPSVAQKYVESGENDKTLPPETIKYLSDIHAIRPIGLKDKEEPRFQARDPSQFASTNFNFSDIGEAPTVAKKDAPPIPDMFEDIKDRVEKTTTPSTESKVIDGKEYEPPERPRRSENPEDLRSKATDLFRDEEGEISAINPLTAGAVAIGAGMPTGAKTIALNETALNNAKVAYEGAKAQLSAVKSLTGDELARQGVNKLQLEADALAKQSAVQKLEAQLAQSQKALNLVTPAPLPNAGTGNFNYAKTFGATDIDASRAVDMSKGQGGAWDQIKKGAEQEAKVQRLQPGAKPVPSMGNLYLPDELANKMNTASKNVMGAGEARVADINEKLATAREQSANAQRLSQSAREAGEKSATRLGEGLIKPTGRVAETSSILGSAEKAVPKGAMASLAKAPMLIPRAVNALGGLGVGLNVTEAMNRYERGDTRGAVLSGAKAFADAMAMVPPTTPPTAVAKAIGLGGGLALEVIDYYLQSRKQPTIQPKNASEAKGMLSKEKTATEPRWITDKRNQKTS